MVLVAVTVSVVIWLNHSNAETTSRIVVVAGLKMRFVELPNLSYAAVSFWNDEILNPPSRNCFNTLWSCFMVHPYL